MTNSIILRRCDLSTNIDRYYEMSLQKALIDHWCVIVRYARYRKQGRQMIYTFTCMKEAMVFMDKKLKLKLKNKYEIYGGCEGRWVEK